MVLIRWSSSAVQGLASESLKCTVLIGLIINQLLKRLLFGIVWRNGSFLHRSLVRGQ